MLLHSASRAQNLSLPNFAAATLILLVFLANFACTAANLIGNDNKTENNNNAPSETDLLLESLITAVDNDGNPTEVIGYTENSSIKKTDAKFTAESFLPEGSKNDKAFEFIPPPDYSPEFSEPVMVTGTYLGGASTFVGCEDLNYHAGEPTFAELLTFVHSKDLCSDISFNFCVKLTSIVNPDKAFYLKTPRMDFNLLCANEAFADINFAINGGSVATSDHNVDLQITTKNVVTSMYITNSSDCTSGGSWESTTTAKKTWTLAPLAKVATVYVRFSDILGNETSCLNDTIIYDNQVPTGESISISSGSTYTTSATVTVGLSASDASAMYITNTSGCGSGGSWEAYATTKASWGLGQTNATATVYVKFRDEALNETPCTSDSIVHDGVAPSSPTSFIDGNTTSSISTSPTLFWSASTDAGSGVAGYEVAIGTTAGDDDVKGWTNVGNVEFASVSDLSTMVGSTNYYASIRALDAAGNPSSVVSGDGFTLIQWRQQAYIKASNSDTNDQFGKSVSLFGDTLAVGSYGEASNQTTITNGTSASTNNGYGYSGAAYVYKRTGTIWQQEAYVKASNSNFGDTFGSKLALGADTLAVGAYQEDSNQTTITNGTSASTDNSISLAGAVYVYKRTSSSWVQEAYIKASNSDAEDWFGYVFDLSGDTLAVGSDHEDSNQTTIINGASASTDNSSADSGAAYVYNRTGTIWQQEAYIKASNSNASDLFGTSVALSADTLAVGASGEDSDQTTITNGTSASTNNSNSASGAVYVYKRTGTIWQQEAYIKASNNNSSDQLGGAVAIDGDSLAVGACCDYSNQTTISNGTSASTNNSMPGAGAVHVYKRTASSWAQEAYIKSSNASANDFFGARVDLSGDTLAVGVYLEESNQTTITNGSSASTDNSSADSGAVYVYKRTGTFWEQEAYIKASNSNADDKFGYSIALSGHTLAVGSYQEDSNQTTITNGTLSSTDNSSSHSGAVYIYTR